MKRILLLLLFGLGVFSAQSQITVDNTLTVQQLVDDVLVLGQCAEVNNVTSPMNSDFAGLGFDSFGAFDGTTSTPVFPFDGGIILATNGIDMVPTGLPNQNGGNPPWLGDADLDALISEPNGTNNATIIEFEFIPFVDQISFNYLLASDEYPSFVCTFADTFAFILSGPGISDVNNYDHDANPNTPELSLDLGGQNIAVIPGTTIPVSPVNIHTNTACGAGSLGEFAVPQLFDQTNSNNGTTMYGGQTVPLTATASVIPGQTYNIKLVIADRGDTILNSAVFLESESFDLGGIDLGPNITIANGNAPCEGEVVTLDAGFSATNIQYFWAKDGNIIPGENDQTLEVTENGDYEVGIQIGAGGTACFGVSNLVTVEFYPEPTFDPSDPINLCQGETTVLDGTPTNASAFTSIDYQWFKDGVELTGETNPTLTVDDSGQYQVVIDANACDDVPNTFDVNLVDYQVSLPIPPQNCVGQGETVEVVPEFTGLTDSEISQVTYEWSTGETTPTIQLSEAGTVSVTTTYEGCEESVTETFTFFNNPQVSIAGSPTLCDGDVNTLDATPVNVNDLDSPTYAWTLDGNPLPETTPVIDINEGGLYEVTIDNNGCTSSDQLEVDFVSYTLDLGDDQNLCTGDGGPQNITLTPDITGLTSVQQNQILYTWSDGSTEETLTVSESGTYTLETDVNGCIQTAQVSVSIVETIDVSLQDILKCPEDEVVLDTGLPDDDPNITYSWTLNGNPVGDNSPSFNASEEGTYIITVDNQGCTSTATAEVSGYDVDNCVITQGISPNEDGANDCMDLTWLNDQLGIDRFQVFNRYGRKVFDETNYEDTFCGQDDNGDELSTGTYFYVINLANSDQRFERVVKGWVYINLEQQ
ncbi:MAG: hypothetical protein GVY05_10500 [Bacteroidetes bacterium]|jgi:gliding motility-associated-like protein|nr:hypothetical protein [Bacteroidota bacterium]